MTNNGTNTNQMQQLSGYLIDKTLDSPEKREDTDFLSKNLFPIITEVNRTIEAPPPLLWFQYCVLFFQLFFGSYFIFHRDDLFSHEFLTFCKVIFFGIIGDRNSARLFFILLFVIDFLTFIIILIILLDYRNNHKFKVWQLNILRIWHGLLFTYFLFPNIFFLPFAISSFYIDFQWTYIFLFIASLLSVAYTIVHVIYLTNLLNQSPFLFRCISIHWRPPEFFYMLIISAIPYAIDGLVPDSSSGFRYFPPILTIFVSCYIIYKMYYLPFTYLFSNVACSSIAIGMILNSIFSIIRNIDRIKLHRYYHIFIPLGIIFVSFPLIWLLFSIRRKRIKNSLMYQTAFPEDDPNNEGLKQSYLSTLNINRKRKAFTYLQVGIEEGADLFLDWSLSNYIFENFEDDGDILLFLTWTISFFPSETSTMLQAFIHSIPNVKRLSIVNRCLLYQLHRLHIFRQSSSMAEANSDLLHIQKMTDYCTSIFCQVWKKLSNPEFEISHDFYQIFTETRRSTEAAWAEILDKYPNDARLVNEYARFLLDCRCNFREAVHYHQRATAIEKGARFQNDRMFHRFVQMFPFYLKKGIVDTSGKMKKKPAIQNNQAQQQNQQQDYSITNAMQNDSSFEDSSDEADLVEAEQFIPRAQLRFAFERAVSEIDSPVLKKVIATEIISVSIAVAYFIIIAVMLTNMFDEKIELFNYLSSINKIIETYEIIAPKITRMWADQVYGQISQEIELDVLGPSINEMPNYLNIETPDDQTIYNLSLVGLSYLDDFSSALYHSGNKNGNRIINLIRLISDAPIQSAVCIDQNKTLYTNNQYMTIDFLWRSLFLTASRLVTRSNFSNQHELSITLCETYTKNHIISKATKLIQMNVSESFSYEYQLLKRCNASHFIDNEEDKKIPNNPLTCPSPSIQIGDPKEEIVPTEVESYSADSSINFLIAFTPFLFLGLVLPSAIFLISAIWTEKVDMTKKLQTFSEQECLDASEVIIKKEDSEELEESSDSQQKTKHKNYLPIYLINIFCILLIIALLLVQLINGISYNQKLNNIIEHSSLFTCLCNTMVTSAHNSLLLIFLNELKTGQNHYINFIEDLSILKDHIKRSLQLILLAGNMLQKGYSNVPSAVGYINEIQKIINDEKCSFDPNSPFMFERYRCLSYYRILDYFYYKIQNITDSFDSYSIQSNESLLFSKLIESRLAIGFHELCIQYEETFNYTIKSFALIVWICFVVGIFFSFLSFGIKLFLVSVSNRDLYTFKCLILRVDPVAFASNPQALSLIYGKKSLVDTRIISASHSVFYSSSDAMMSLNQDGIIESLNPAASNIFGYTPEQMLGQNIKLLINPEIKKNDQLFYTIQLMKSGQCSLIFESDFAGSRDDETILPLRVTLIGFSSNDRVAGSFAIICRDKTEDEKLRIQVESAQKETEDLLLQFVPQEMLSKLNKEEPEIGFSVPSSTISIINVVKFSNYMITVQPEELLSNLTKIFASFDKILSSIPNATKIKIIGDVYIAAAGLFTEELLPSSHATDLIGFALKTLDSIEELNIQLNSSLQTRIGVHTGGPLIAGVFGKNRQIFEIIGPTVSACQKLEKNCIPGTINISNDTYLLLPQGRYHIEEHEEIELDGTEKQMTYVLHPGHISASPTNNMIYTPLSLDALLGGGNSGTSFNIDIMAPFPDDSMNNNPEGSFTLPSLASLVDPNNQPQ